MICTDRAPRRLTDGTDWIAEVCRQFTEATGWPLHFSDVSEAAGKRSPEGNASVFSECWSMELHCGERLVGRLHIDLPHDPGLDRRFLAICELADITGHLVSRLLNTVAALEQKSRDLELLLRLESSPLPEDPREVLQDYLGSVTELTGFRAAAFFLISEDARQLRLRAAYGLEQDALPHKVRTLADLPPDLHALQRGRFSLLNASAGCYRSWLPDGLATAHCVSVDTSYGPAGTLWLFDRRERQLLPEKEAALKVLARRLGDLLERVVLLQESHLHRRQNHDLQQASLCYRETASPQQLHRRRYETASICSSRFELGGDLCDVIPLSEEAAVLLVGDASGDSVPAAMVMSAVRGAVRATLATFENALPRPEVIIARANSTLCGLSAMHQFMSLWVGVLDMSRNRLTYANAGHPPPVLLHKGEARPLQHHDLLLGVVPDSDYEARTIPVQPGDWLAAYSDGISEAMDAQGRLFGTEGVCRTLNAAAEEESAQQMLQHILRQVETHSLNAHSADDRTLLVVRLK